MNAWLRPAALGFVATCLGAPLLAQAPRYEPPAARLPAGTRALAMGGAFVVGRGSETIFYNPAQLALQAGVSASVQRYEAASTHAALSAANALGGRFGYGVGVTMVEYSTTPAFLPPPCNVCDVIHGGIVPASSLTATVGASARVIGVRWGLAAKYIGEHIEDARHGTVAVDVGAAKEIGLFAVGVSAQNLGADFDVTPRGLGVSTARAELPRRATLGAAIGGYAIGTWLDLGGNAAVTVLRDGFVVPMGGGELSYAPLEGWAIDLRAGVRRVRSGSGERPLTLGGGVTLDRFSLDYAMETFTGGVTAHRVGVRVR